MARDWKAEIAALNRTIECLLLDAGRERLVRRIIDLALKRSLEENKLLQVELRAALNLGKVGTQKFPDMKIEFEVWTAPYGRRVHRGSFNLADHNERRSFAVRVNEAQYDGFEVRTRRADIP